ncbi:unnamed protein product [Caenorhabditis bovis]|uniref:Uncharacterized protein n=1 Tax=Caenorhabditis bovis TaxID=2654633 RepID=A0A8S1EU52_9PELO|nr:unnamed protein product [Caenorhabditis bovis]
MRNFRIFLAISLIPIVVGIEREALIEHLKYQQEARNTFDSRIRQGDFMQPIGYVAGKPIWPRVLEKVRSTGELFFDDNNFAYLVHNRSPAALVRKMDREANYKAVMEFLSRYT